MERGILVFALLPSGTVRLVDVKDLDDASAHLLVRTVLIQRGVMIAAVEAGDQELRVRPECLALYGEAPAPSVLTYQPGSEDA
jgi:hypothetical protein